LRAKGDFCETTVFQYQRTERTDMGLKKFIWAVVNVATLGIVQEWFTFAILWDDGEIEYLRGHTVGQALNQSGYTADTVDDHMVSYCIVNPGELHPDDPEYH
jgi:hypothetical protein